ncbi:CBS domain-containing protein [Nocardia sp. NBC_01730]|uniref:CBS domain-containing protein n=1 Tax=Nocardia sp. NBC_01730 TaxID=2975998 RepID=UPI002E1456AE|nr:CBS domain-containing protein [Nocardia sp. NBC_01730]
MNEVPVEHSRQAWLIRGGSDGEREMRALREGLAVIGWVEIGDLAAFATWEDLVAGLQSAYPAAGRATIGNWAGQLWKFDTEIQVGDLVVMPLKRHPGSVAIGYVSGPYQYRTGESADFRQVRPVDWRRTDVAWDSIRPDLRASLGSLLTVCGLSRNDAVRRIAHLAEHGTDPGFAGDEVVTSASELLKAAAERDPADPKTLTIRGLLGHWDAERRTAPVIDAVKADLAAAGLTTRPPFTEGSLSDPVALVQLGTEPDDPAAEITAEDVEDVTEREPMTRRLDGLPAKLVSVAPTDTLTFVKTLMLQRNFSQVAVIDAEGTYHGAITWESIGRAHIASDSPSLRSTTISISPVDHDALLLDQIDAIRERGFILVRSTDRTQVTGILTASDLTAQFGTLARPFLLVEEAENRLRRAVDTLDFEEVKKAVKAQSWVKQPSNLTFGNYVHLLKKPEWWSKIGWKLDHEQFVDLLEAVRKMRNELMHFAPDPVAEEKFAAVTGLLELLRAADPHP